MAINQNKPKTQPLVFVKKRHHSREIVEIFLNEGNLCGKAFTERVTLNGNVILEKARNVYNIIHIWEYLKEHY